LTFLVEYWLRDETSGGWEFEKDWGSDWFSKWFYCKFGDSPWFLVEITWLGYYVIPCQLSLRVRSIK